MVEGFYKQYFALALKVCDTEYPPVTAYAVPPKVGDSRTLHGFGRQIPALTSKKPFVIRQYFKTIKRLDTPEDLNFRRTVLDCRQLRGEFYGKKNNSRFR